MEFNCDKHKQFHPIYLKLDDKKFFKCAKCITEFKLSGESLVLVEEVNKCEDSTIISNWPPVTDVELLSKVEQIVNKESDTSQIKKLTDFFECFRKDLNEQLNSLQQVVTAQIDKYQNSSLKLLRVYNQLAEKQVFKELLEKQESAVQIQDQLHTFVNDKLRERGAVTTELLNAIESYNESVQEISLDFPLKIKEDILHSLEKISLFLEEDNCKQNSQQEDQNCMKFSQISNHSSPTNVDILFQLISNKSNFCSEKYLLKVRSILQKYSVLINKEDLKNPFIESKCPTDFSMLRATELDDIQLLAKHFSFQNKMQDEGKSILSSEYIDQIYMLISNRTNSVSKFSLQKIKAALEKVEPFFKDTLQQEESELINFSEMNNTAYETIRKLAKKLSDSDYLSQPSENVNKLMTLISNSTNFLRSNVLSDVEDSLNKIKPIIDEIQMESEDMFVSQPIDFKFVTFDQLQSIQILANKYSEMNVNPVSHPSRANPKKYLSSPSKSIEQLENECLNNTFIVSQYIDFKFFSESDQSKIKQVMARFPIFETIDIANPYKDLTNEVSFVASKYNDSDKNVKIWRNHSKELVIEHFQQQNRSIQTIFDSNLDPNLKYIVRIEVDPTNNFNYYSRIGLIRPSLKDSHRIFSDNMCFCNQNSYGMTKVLKGKRLNDPSLRFSLKTRNLEFRIWIKGKIFIVADYPNYYNVNSIEDDSKEIELYPSLTLGTLGFNIKNFIVKYFKVVEHFPIY